MYNLDKIDTRLDTRAQFHLDDIIAIFRKTRLRSRIEMKSLFVVFRNLFVHIRVMRYFHLTIDPFDKSDTRTNHVRRNRDSIFEQIHGCFKFISEKRVSDWPRVSEGKFRLHRLNSRSQGRVNADSGGYVVVLHFDHDFFVHCQLGRVPHRREDGFADRERRGSCKADENQIRSSQRRQHRGLFQGKIGWITHQSFHRRPRLIVFMNTLPLVNIPILLHVHSTS